MANKNIPKKKSLYVIFFNTFFLTVFICSLYFYCFPSKYWKTPKEIAIAKTCFHNLEILQKAVNEYNNDPKNTKKICDYELINIDELYKENYLKEKLSITEDKCHYIVDEYLSKGGVIYCTYHGNIKANIKGYYDDFEKKINEHNHKLRNKYYEAAILCLGLPFLYLVFSLI